MPSLLNSEQRTRSIVRAGLMGIAVNFVYALLKGGIGLMSGSIAIFLDALNNMSDAVTAVIAAAGARLARRPADRFHPFGHGRVEYLSSLAISVIIVVIGVMSLTSAVRKIIHPEAAHYTLLMLLIMATGVVAKLSLGIYTLRAGRRESSDSLRGAGTENLFDAFVTLATILSALILSVVLLAARKEKPSGTDVLLGVYLGVPNYLSSLFLLRSLSEVPAMAAYPVYSLGAVAVVALFSLLLFGERPDRREMRALAVILAAILLLNL